MAVVIDRATVLEFPQIEAMRTVYFARMGEPVQRRSDMTIWVCAREGELVRGCYSYEDVLDYGQRWVMDFYLAEMCRLDRVAVALMMRDDIYKQADESGLDVLFHVHPENRAHLRAILRHGEVQPAGVLFLRKVRNTACLPQ